MRPLAEAFGYLRDYLRHRHERLLAKSPSWLLTTKEGHEDMLANNHPVPGNMRADWPNCDPGFQTLLDGPLRAALGRADGKTWRST